VARLARVPSGPTRAAIFTERPPTAPHCIRNSGINSILTFGLGFLIDCKHFKGLLVVPFLLFGGLRAQAQAMLHKDLKKRFWCRGRRPHQRPSGFPKSRLFFQRAGQNPAGTGRAVLHLLAGTYLVEPPGPATVLDLLGLHKCLNINLL